MDTGLNRNWRSRDRDGQGFCNRLTGQSHPFDQLPAEFLCHFPTVGPGALAQEFPIQGSPDPLGTVAAAPGFVAGVFAFGMVAGIDGQHRLSRLQRDCALFAEVEQNFGRDCTVTVQFYPKILAGSDKSFMINDLFMVEAAGVEPDISVENTQLTDSGNASFAGNAMISKSTVQTLYKLFLEFPERQSSAFPSWRRRRILKRSRNSYTSAEAVQELNCV
jgi:hypothetical protein